MKIIYTQENGVVAVIHPAPGVDIQSCTKSVPDGVEYEIVEDSVIPTDRTFREAWRKGSGKVDVDFPAAKAIAHEKRRAKRDALYEPEDKRATSPVASIKNAALAAKQAIYDNDAAVQASIDAAGDVDTLKQILADYNAI